MVDFVTGDEVDGVGALQVFVDGIVTGKLGFVYTLG